MIRRTPTKIRSRRESLRPDEIPTRDTPPSTSRDQKTSKPNTHQGRSHTSTTLHRHGGDTTPALNNGIGLNQTEHRPSEIHSQSKTGSNFRRSVSMDFTSNPRECDDTDHPVFIYLTDSPQVKKRRDRSVSMDLTNNSRDFGHNNASTDFPTTPLEHVHRGRTVSVDSASKSRHGRHRRVPVAMDFTGNSKSNAHSRWRRLTSPAIIKSPVPHPSKERQSASIAGLFPRFEIDRVSHDDDVVEINDVDHEETKETPDNDDTIPAPSEIATDESSTSNVASHTASRASHVVPNMASKKTSRSTFPTDNSLSMSDFEASEPTARNLSKSIYQMWRNKQLCDVVFFVEEDRKTFYAHKLVLATTCDLFVEKTSETGLFELHLPNVIRSNMKQILKFFYTGRIEITINNVEDCLEVSKQLKCSKLTNVCKDFLLDATMATSVRHGMIALKYGLQDVALGIDSYIHEHFTSLINSETFLKSDFRIVHEIISSDMLNSPDELQIFQACASWINYDPDDRMCYVIPLMDMVRFHLISPGNLVSHVEQTPFMVTTPECKDMLYNAFRHHALFRDIIQTVAKTTPGSSGRSGSRSGRAAPRSTPCYRSPGTVSPDEEARRSSSGESDVPDSKQDGVDVIEKPRSSSSIRAGDTRFCDNTEQDSAPDPVLYKGTSPQNKSFREAQRKIINTLRLIKAAAPQAHSDVEKRRKSLKPDTTSTSNQTSTSSAPEVPDPTFRRSSVKPAGSVKVLPSTAESVVKLKNKTSSTLKVGARDSKEGLQKRRSSTLNDRENNVTFSQSELRKRRSSTLQRDAVSQNEMSPILAGSGPFNVNASSDGTCISRIFTAGGENPFVNGHDSEQIDVNLSLQQYDPESNTWSVVSKIPKPLRYLSVTMLGDHLYIIGGLNTSDDVEETPSRDCYEYIINTGEWRQIGSLKTSRAYHAAVTINDVIYVIGGLDCLEMGLKSMESYDVEDNEWFFTQPMKDARFYFAAVAHRDKILVVGGKTDVDDERLLNTVEVFDPNTGNWTSRNRFPLHVGGGSMAEVCGSVYHVGGFVYQDRPLSIDSIFRYCDDTDSWAGFQTLRVPRNAALVAAIGCKIYVIGGESSSSLGPALDNVECIDVETNEHVTGIAPLLAPAYALGGCSWNENPQLIS